MTGDYCEVSIVNDIAVCYEDDITDMYARASYFDPLSCPESPVNCYEDTWEYLGDGTESELAYGNFMACPIGLYSSVITFEKAGTWQCRDSGGAIKQGFGSVYTSKGWKESWYIIFDFALYEPEYWVYDLLEIIEVE